MILTFTMNEFKKNLFKSTGFRFFLYLIVLLVCSLIGGLVTMLLTDDINMLKLGQGISSTMIFIVPPLVLYGLTRYQPLQAIGFRRVSNAWLLLIGVALMFVSLPMTGKFMAWNEAMNFGPAFEKLEQWLRMLEDTAADLTEKMLQVHTFGGLLFNLLVIALIPAIGEELTFRGLLQQSLMRGCKNAHVAILLTAAIFSFIHFQFYGFLPRMFLGILLGYMFYYSGSLWTSILMHFINNGTAVVVSYLEFNGLSSVDADSFGATDKGWVILLSLLLTMALLWLSHRLSRKPKGVSGQAVVDNELK